MNKLTAEKEALIDQMMVLAYSTRVIAEVAQVSRATVQQRRQPMVWHRGFWFVYCPCGKPIIDPDTDHFHDQEPCARRSRRNRLLLRIVRKKRMAISWTCPNGHLHRDRTRLRQAGMSYKCLVCDGFFNRLSDVQKAEALAYRGPEDHGPTDTGSMT